MNCEVHAVGPYASLLNVTPCLCVLCCSPFVPSVCALRLGRYLGAFTTDFRKQCVADWLAKCREKGVPCSAAPRLAVTYGDPIKIRQWHIQVWGSRWCCC